METRRIATQYKGVFTSPPTNVPTEYFVDGPLMGNGDVGVVISGRPEAQRFWISKNDFWKARPGNYKGGGPMLIGGIDMRIPAIAGATYHTEQLLYEPVIKSCFSKEETTVTIHSWVSALENLLIIELSSKGKAVAVESNLWAQAGHGSTTKQGTSGGVYWVTRKFDEPGLDWRSEAAIAVRFLEMGSNASILEPGRPVTVVASIVTNHDTKGYLKAARERVSLLAFKDVKSIRMRHVKWWQDFWSKSFIEIGDKLIEKFWYGSHYIMACCSRNRNFPPGLFGNWITTDNPAWAGDYHLNYNHEAPWWGVYSSNHVELSDPYDTPILQYMSKGKENARIDLCCRGVYYPVGIGPKGLSITDLLGEHGPYQAPRSKGHFLGQKSNAVFASANMFMRFYHTYDLDYARRVYPYLIEVADFWEDYLKFEPFDKLRPGNGRYVIYKDNLGEDEVPADMNPAISLGFVRMLFKGLLDMSRELDVNANRCEKWRHILTHISKFPIVEKNGIKRCRGAEAGPSSKLIGLDYGWLFHGMVWPGGVVGLDSDPELLHAVRNDVKEWRTEPERGLSWIDRGIHTTFPVAARVGHDSLDILAKLRQKVQRDGLANLWILEKKCGIETCSGIPATINEMLLQSHENILRLFPVWPEDMPARFGSLRAYGAFLVMAGFNDGEVQYAFIESEKGRDCTLLNPWPGKIVNLYRGEKNVEKLAGNRITFKTDKGEQVMLGPEDVPLDELQHRMASRQ